MMTEMTEMTEMTRTMSDLVAWPHEDPARVMAVVFGWCAIWFVVLRLGFRMDTWLQDIEDGRRGFF